MAGGEPRTPEGFCQWTAHIAATKARNVAVLLLAALSSAATAQITWRTDYDSARSAAIKTKKPILVDFMAEWCGPCKMMQHDALENPTVTKLLQRVVCVRLDVDKLPPLAKRFSVNGIPRTILLSPDGQQVKMDLEGYRDAEGFASELGQALNVQVGPIAKTNDPPQLVKVRDSLAAGKYRQLAQADPATAKAGLALLVAQLGAFDEAQFTAAATLVQKLGKTGVPALLNGMADKSLAVRVGSYRVMQSVLDKGAHHPPFDPWAKSAVRTAQLAAWRKAVGL